MCGIVGYVGDKQAEQVVIDGLRRLEYRGDDSAGVALVVDGQIAYDKKAGKLFRGKSCGLSKDPNWKVEKKNMK